MPSKKITLFLWTEQNSRSPEAIVKWGSQDWYLAITLA
jgi:hypothetical protein